MRFCRSFERDDLAVDNELSNALAFERRNELRVRRVLLGTIPRQEGDLSALSKRKTADAIQLPLENPVWVREAVEAAAEHTRPLPFRWRARAAEGR
jgi:hypothetical protein